MTQSKQIAELKVSDMTRLLEQTLDEAQYKLGELVATMIVNFEQKGIISKFDTPIAMLMKILNTYEARIAELEKGKVGE